MAHAVPAMLKCTCSLAPFIQAKSQHNRNRQARHRSMALRRRRPLPLLVVVAAVVVATAGGFLFQASPLSSSCSWRRHHGVGAARADDVLVKSSSDTEAALQRLRALVGETVRLMAPDPAEALRRGTWFKLICGASYQDLPRITTLALVYTLAGADCIDMSASEAVVTAVTEGVDHAVQLAARLGHPLPRRPWLMVSVNDQEDLHFRKASFDATRCPADCPRPCEAICPTRAIPPVDANAVAALPSEPSGQQRVEGVAVQGRCYGCGRCLAVCPLGLIEAQPYQVDAAAVLGALAGRVDALEIHTNASSFSSSQHGHDEDPFQQLCHRLRGRPSDGLRLVSVSFPFFGERETAAFLRHRRQLLAGLGAPVRIWQTDGRPMSGDIGNGTTLSCVRFGETVLRGRALPFFPAAERGGDNEGEGEEQHFLQLAGGTNAYTAEKLEAEGLLSPMDEAAHGGSWVHGLAFGGFARKEVDRAMAAHGLGLEDAIDEGHPEALAEVLRAALGVVRPIKARRQQGRQQHEMEAAAG